jgi:hypothetical protein
LGLCGPASPSCNDAGSLEASGTSPMNIRAAHQGSPLPIWSPPFLTVVLRLPPQPCGPERSRGQGELPFGRLRFLQITSTFSTTVEERGDAAIGSRGRGFPEEQRTRFAGLERQVVAVRGRVRLVAVSNFSFPGRRPAAGWRRYGNRRANCQVPRTRCTQTVQRLIWLPARARRQRRHRCRAGSPRLLVMFVARRGGGRECTGGSAARSTIYVGPGHRLFGDRDSRESLCAVRRRTEELPTESDNTPRPQQLSH